MLTTFRRLLGDLNYHVTQTNHLLSFIVFVLANGQILNKGYHDRKFLKDAISVVYYSFSSLYEQSRYFHYKIK